VKVGGNLINGFRIGDDQAVAAKSKASLQKILNAIEKMIEEKEMKISTHKTNS